MKSIGVPKFKTAVYKYEYRQRVVHLTGFTAYPSLLPHGLPRNIELDNGLIKST